MSGSIMVTGIGGNVGQGILKNIAATFDGIRLIGTDISLITAGQFYCDRTYQVPLAKSESYLEKVREICAQEQIELIIPATDDETFELSRYQELLPPVLGSDNATAGVFVDKLKTAQCFGQFGIPFAESCSAAEYNGQWNKNIAKPREGRGSRGILIDVRDTGDLAASYMVQRRYEGPEITSALYISRENRILGPITFERTLLDGMTEKCWVVDQHDDQVLRIAKMITQNLDVCGPINIQSIVDSGTGEVMPFEINGRYSGTNSIRAHFGFKDVEMGVNEWLFDISPKQLTITPGSAIRIYSEIIYPECEIAETASNNDKAYLA